MIVMAPTIGRMIEYKLSSRQLRTLASGTGLRIALPQTSWCPFDGKPDELRQWFCDSLSNIDASLVGSVVLGHCWVHLFNRGGGDRSLAKTLGEIVDADRALDMPCYSMRVVIGVIGNGERLTRWPAGEIVFARPDKF